MGGAAEKSIVRKANSEGIEDFWHYSCPGISSSYTSCEQMFSAGAGRWESRWHRRQGVKTSVMDKIIPCQHFDMGPDCGHILL